MVRGPWRVVLALPAVSGDGPMPQRQPPVPVLRGTLAPVVNAGEVNRALPLLLVHGPKPQVLTGIVTNDNEVLVVLQQQNAQKEEDVEAAKEPEKVNQLPSLTENYVPSQVLHGVIGVRWNKNAQKEEDVEAAKEPEKVNQLPSLTENYVPSQVLHGVIGVRWNKDAQKKEDVEAEEEPKKSEGRSLPVGTALLSVAGVELPGSAVGPALEFLEFCAAFYEPLEIKEEEALMALREIVRGCKLGKGWGSQVVRVHMSLLNVILEDSYEQVSPRSKSKNSWLIVLGRYMMRKARTLVKVTTLPSTSLASSNPAFSPSLNSMLKYSTTLESGADGYLSLSVDEKLQLLNTLCNDTLSTALIREHIEKGIDDEERKEEKAKKRKKEVKNRKSEASTSAPRIEERRTVPSVRTRSAYVGLPESSDSGKFGNTKTRRSAVKTEAIVWLNGLHALWNLKGGDDRRAVISQDISNIEGIPKEEWTVYSEEDKKALTVYLAQKKKLKRAYHRKESGPSNPVPSIDVGISAMDLASKHDSSTP